MTLSQMYIIANLFSFFYAFLLFFHSTFFSYAQVHVCDIVFMQIFGFYGAHLTFFLSLSLFLLLLFILLLKRTGKGNVMTLMYKCYMQLQNVRKIQQNSRSREWKNRICFIFFCCKWKGHSTETAVDAAAVLWK